MILKKIAAFFAGCALAMTVAACGAASPSSQPAQPATSVSGGKPAKVLVAYFSQPETAKADHMTKEEANSTVVINGKVLGNTEYMAKLIIEDTGADEFRIDPAKPYPTDHKVLVPLARKELDEGARPAIASKVDNMDQYDVIFLGYPNWWGDMPMIMYTFLDTYDLSGKVIIPFNTHGGSGFSNTIQEIAKAEPNAKVYRNGLSISRDDIQDAAADVEKWLHSIRLDGLTLTHND